MKPWTKDHLQAPWKDKDFRGTRCSGQSMDTGISSKLIASRTPRRCSDGTVGTLCLIYNAHLLAFQLSILRRTMLGLEAQYEHRPHIGQRWRCKRSDDRSHALMHYSASAQTRIKLVDQMNQPAPFHILTTFTPKGPLLLFCNQT